MPGTGTKQQKKAAAPARAATSSAPFIITVSGGKPDPDDVTVSSGDRIQFTNDDEVCYIIQMTSKNASAPAAHVVLPGLSTVSVVAAATLQQQTATYQLTALQAAGVRTDTGGGGGRIIINP
jgi:plastocyanin